MYRTKEMETGSVTITECGMIRRMKEKILSVDTLLNLTETIATMAMAAGFLLLVAALLASVR